MVEIQGLYTIIKRLPILLSARIPENKKERLVV